MKVILLCLEDVLQVVSLNLSQSPFREIVFFKFKDELLISLYFETKRRSYSKHADMKQASKFFGGTIHPFQVEGCLDIGGAQSLRCLFGRTKKSLAKISFLTLS